MPRPATYAAGPGPGGRSGPGRAGATAPARSRRHRRAPGARPHARPTASKVRPAADRPRRDPGAGGRGADGVLRVVAARLPPAARPHRRPQGPDRRARGEHRRSSSGRSGAGTTRRTSAQQARERFGYVMPGETTYLVLDENGEPLESEADARPTPTRSRRQPERPGATTPGTRSKLAGDPPTKAPPTRCARSTAPTSSPPTTGSRVMIPPEDEAAVAAQLGRAAAGHPRRRAPLPLRQPRRGHHRAAAARRHAVPDDLLPDLPARRVADRHPRGLGADEGDAGPAGRGRRAGRGVPRRARALPRGPVRRSARCPRSTASPRAGCPTGSSACTCWPARRWRRAAASTRSATRCSTCSASGGPPARASRGSRVTVAAIDCGTNTIKLLIGDLPDVAVRETRMVRLGQDVDRTGRLADEALARAFAAIDEYAALIDGTTCDRLRFCATSATRDAANADVFVAGVVERLGVRPEVLTGDEEAALAFDGAVRNLRDRPGPPVLVVDIGGGSTELILGDTAAAAGGLDGHRLGAAARAAPARRPADRRRGGRVRRRHRRDLDACPVDAAAAATVVGVAGTVTTVAAGVLDLPAYDREAIDQAVLRVDDVHAIVERLLAMPVAERLDAAVAAPRPRRRDRRRGADPVPRAAPGPRRDARWSRSPTSSTGSPGRWLDADRFAGRRDGYRARMSTRRRIDPEPTGGAARRPRAPAHRADPGAGAQRDAPGPGRADREGQARRHRRRAVQRRRAARAVRPRDAASTAIVLALDLALPPGPPRSS